MLAKRYASPMPILNEMIRQRRLFEFVLEVNQIVQDDMLFDIWKHRIFDKSFEEWKNSVITRTGTNTATKSELEATVLNSKELISGFCPK